MPKMAFRGAFWASIFLLASCGGNPPSDQAPADSLGQPTANEPAMLKPLVKLSDPDFAAFVQQFALASLPLNTANDSSTVVGSSLFTDPTTASKYFLPESEWPQMLQVSAYRRLPDYGNFVALIFAAHQQESGGLLLLLVTYTPAGKPVAQLWLKQDADSGGYSAFTQDAVVAADMHIEVGRTEITYAGGGENYRETARKPVVAYYQLQPDGKIEKRQ
jgi:hypothetical protein